MEENIHKAPAPFNPDYRPGLGEAVSKSHREWCEENPNVTRKERAAAYRETHERMEKDYPSVEEISHKRISKLLDRMSVPRDTKGNEIFPYPRPEVDGKNTFWYYRSGGFMHTPDNGYSYGRCANREDAERIIKRYYKDKDENKHRR